MSARRRAALGLLAAAALLAAGCRADGLRPDPEGRRLRFVAMADSRGTDNGVNSAELGKFVRLILALTPRPAFVIVPGDLVTNGGEAELAYWKTIMQPLRDAGIALYPVPGNHEMSSGSVAAQAAFSAAFELPGDGPAGYTGLCYSFAVGDLALFVGLDSSYFDAARGRVLNHVITPAQRDWLSLRLAASRARYKFVFAHAPAYPSGAHLGESLDQFPAERDAFWQILDDADATAYFCGHEHNYSRRLIDAAVDGRWRRAINQLVVGSCGAPLSSVRVTPVDLFQAAYHMCIVDLDAGAAEFTVVDDRFRLLDRFVVIR